MGRLNKWRQWRDRLARAATEFLSRPRGAMELETYLAAVELSWGIQALWSADAIANTGSLSVLAYYVPNLVIALPFMVSALLTIIGLGLFFRGNTWCAPLRWAGSLFSVFIWSWVFVKGWSLTGGELLTIWTYFFSAVAWARIMISAWRRPWPGS